MVKKIQDNRDGTLSITYDLDTVESSLEYFSDVSRGLMMDHPLVMKLIEFNVQSGTTKVEKLYPINHMSDWTLLAFQLLSIIHYLDSCAVSHSDLHSANFMTDEYGNLKIIDFGISISQMKVDYNPLFICSLLLTFTGYLSHDCSITILNERPRFHNRCINELLRFVNGNEIPEILYNICSTIIDSDSAAQALRSHIFADYNTIQFQVPQFRYNPREFQDKPMLYKVIFGHWLENVTPSSIKDELEHINWNNIYI